MKIHLTQRIAGFCNYLKKIVLYAAVFLTCVTAAAQQTFTTFQPANLVIGQNNFTSSSGTCIQGSTYGPSYCAISSKGVLAIGHQTGARVSIWKSPFTANGQLPDIIVGQANFLTCTPGATQSKISDGAGVAFSPDGNKLIVSDGNNNRVLIWNTIPVSNGQPADVVIGQSTFTSSAPGSSATTFRRPQGVFVTPDGKLLVTDRTNHRLLIWNSIPTTNGKAADIVVGQPDFTTNSFGSAANKMSQPWGVWVAPNGKLLVADEQNHRVLIFNSVPTINGVNADVVVGQAVFGTSASGLGINRMNTPVGVTVSPDGKMAVGEFGNHRVLIYNSIPTTNGANADAVLGQPNFTTAIAFNPSGTANIQNMRNLYNVSFDLYGRLFVVGRDMHRGMIFGTLPSKKAELGIGMQATAISVCAATPTTNTVTIKNNGPDTATNIVSTTSLPASFSYASHNATKGTYNPVSGYWNISAIPSGDSAVLTINGNSNTAGTFTAYANIIQSNQLDTLLDNNGTSIVYSASGGLNCIFTDSVSSLSLCAGSPLNVYYTKAGTFNTGNFFVAELSDGAGSFNNPRLLDSVNTILSGTINTAIPANTPPGTNYRVRVRSTNPVVTGLNNGSNINIFSAAPVAPVNGAIVCTGLNILKWNRAAGATGYKVYLDAGAGPATTLVATKNSNTDTTYDVGSLAAGPYAWRIAPVNGNSTATGCASWNFTRTAVSRDTISFFGCNSLVYQGNTYTSSATRNDTIKNNSGCDSLIRRINITIVTITPVIQTINLSSCSTPIVYQGITYTTSTTVRDTIRSYQGCDSIYKTANINITNIPPLAVPANMVPVDNRTDLNIPVSFSWSLVPNAQVYDFYLWKVIDPEPTEATLPGLTQINFTYGNLQYGTTYKWKVVARNQNCQSVSAIQSFTTSFLPDLIVERVQPAATGFSGQAFSVTWIVRNRGTGATPVNRQWTDRVFLSTDDSLEIGFDTELGNITNPSALAANGSYPQTATFTLPQGINDNYYVFVVTNAYNQVLETDFTNNTNISDDTSVIQLTPPPDLVVTSVIPPNFAFSGQPISVTWQVMNNGSGPTMGNSWADKIYLTQNANGDLSDARLLGTFTHSGSLRVDSFYNSTKTVQLPNGISGRWYLYVTTDVFNQVYEHALEANNTSRSDSMIVTLTPPVDLVVKDSIIIPAQASNKQPVSISWKVANQGGSATGGNNWGDQVYISKSPVYNQDSVIHLGSFNRVAALDIGQEYTSQRTVTIPAGISGPCYFYIKTDAFDNIYENIFENNNITRSSSTINILSPDLVVTKIIAPATDSSGNTINIQWYVKNNGPGTVQNTAIKDHIRMSLHPVYSDTGSIALIDQIYNTGQLAPGDSLLQQAAVLLPNGYSGDYYIYVLTDYSNDVFENNKENNNTGRSAATIHIVFSPWADLQGNTCTMQPDTSTAGSIVPATYSVVNRGTGHTRSGQWTDKLYISRSPVFDQGATFLRANTRNGNLNKDSLYQVNTMVQLPGDLVAGKYYLYLYCDEANDEFEHTGENNNVKKGDSVYIKAYPPIDLFITDITVPDSAASGNPVNITWTVKSNSQAATLQSQWKDVLRLSGDTSLNSGDTLVKEVPHSGALAPGMSYTVTHSFTIPNGLSGKYYALLVADEEDKNRDVNKANNYKLTGANGDSVILHISLTPPPDLTVSSFTIPDRGFAGQPVKAKFTIVNNDTGTIPANAQWTDKVYLSTDAELNASDPVIGAIVKTGPLPAGQSYTDSIDVFLPMSALGNYVVFIKTDANNTVYEHNNEQNNTRYELITAEPQLLSDLVVTNVIAPAEAIAGDMVTITWKVKNTGQNPASGYMRNAIYLSTDSIKSADDALLVSQPVTINIAPHAEQTFSFTGTLTGVSLNDYHVLAHADVLNNIYETSDTNNIGWSSEKMRVTVRQLPINVLTTGTLPDNIPLYYRIDVPDSISGESLLVTLKGDSLNGHNELYLRFGEIPSRAVYDYSHSLATGGNQEVLVPELRQGIYYLMVYGNTTVGNSQAISLLAKVLNFEILAVNDTAGGNTGQVTLQLKGSKLGNVNTVRLRSGNRNISSNNILITNPTIMFARFNLSGATTGLYDVVAQNTAGDTAVYPQGFRITTNNGGGLEANMITPSSTRPGNTINMRVEFKNTGNTDLINPVLKISSLGGSPIALSPSGLSNNQQTSIILTVQELNGPPGILRAGAGGTITVYSRALTALSFMLVKDE